MLIEIEFQGWNLKLSGHSNRSTLTNPENIPQLAYFRGLFALLYFLSGRSSEHQAWWFCFVKQLKLWFTFRLIFYFLFFHGKKKQRHSQGVLKNRIFVAKREENWGNHHSSFRIWSYFQEFGARVASKSVQHLQSRPVEQSQLHSDRFQRDWGLR